MNRKPFNAAPFVSSIRESAIRLAISVTVELVGTVYVRVMRRAHIAQEVSIVSTVKARQIARAKIAQAVEAVGNFFSGTRRRVHSPFIGTAEVAGLCSPRIRARAKISGIVEAAGTAMPHVLHLIRFGPLVQVVQAIGRVSGNDLATGPADEERHIAVPAYSRNFVVPGGSRLSGVV